MAPKQYLCSKHLFFRNQWLSSPCYAETPATSDINLVYYKRRLSSVKLSEISSLSSERQNFHYIVSTQSIARQFPFSRLRLRQTTVSGSSGLQSRLTLLVNWKNPLYDNGNVLALFKVKALKVPRIWSSHISRQSAHEGGKVVSPTHRPPLPPGDIPGTRFYYGDRGGTVVKVLCYKSEGRWFHSSWCHWSFTMT